MTKVMTATEWTKKRYSVARGMVGNIIIPCMAAMVGVMVYVSKHHQSPPQAFSMEPVQFFLYAFVPSVTCLGLHITYDRWIVNKLVLEHPEMAHHREWEWVMGDLKNYPVPGNEINAFLPAANQLRATAMEVNAAFAVRNALLSVTTKDKPEWKKGIDVVYMNTAYKKAADEAEALNRQYLAEWDLFVTKTRALTADMGYRDPAEYRKGLLKED